MSSLLPPYLFPPVGWFLTGMRAGSLQVGMGGRFIKQTLRSRFVIAGPNGLQTLSVPLLHGTEKNMANMRIQPDARRVREQLRAIETAYGNAPFYEFYDYRLLPLLQDESLTLQELITASIRGLHRELKCEVPLVFTDEVAGDILLPAEPPYMQVFDDRFGFRPGCSALDLLFNLGPEAADYLATDLRQA